jgi:6-pyruvoyltetrahydropterin/6-carboxytetrahydropterin synthase
VIVKKELRDLANHLDHQNLNDLEPFTELEPSAENQARWFYDELKSRFPDPLATSMVYVRVWETPTQWAQYSERVWMP